jgi:hypothetical protein
MEIVYIITILAPRSGSYSYWKFLHPCFRRSYYHVSSDDTNISGASVASTSPMCSFTVLVMLVVRSYGLWRWRIFWRHNDHSKVHDTWSSPVNFRESKGEKHSISTESMMISCVLEYLRDSVEGKEIEDKYRVIARCTLYDASMLQRVCCRIFQNAVQFSIPRQCAWDLCRIKCHWKRFYSHYFGFHNLSLH